MTIKVLSVALAIAVLVALGTGVYGYKQNVDLKAKTILLATAQQSIKDLNKSLEKQAIISKITDEVVNEAVSKTKEVTIKATELSNTVVRTNKGVVDGKINAAVADAIYIDSMWEAYCEANPSADKCTTRRTHTGLSSR